MTYTKTAHPQNAEQAQGFAPTEVAKTLNCHTTPDSEIRAEELVLSYEHHPQDSRLKGIVQNVGCDLYNHKVTGDVATTIAQESCSVAGHSGPSVIQSVAIAENIIGRKAENGGNGVGAQEELAYTQNATGVMGICTKGNGDAFLSDVHTSLSASGGGQTGQGYPACVFSSTVRRLFPVECERLMGFPDNHTRISWNGKPDDECPDAPRYKACGNSMCVNCMEWIGRRIQMVEDEENA